MSAPAGPQAGRYVVVIDVVTIEFDHEKIGSVGIVMQPLFMPLGKGNVIVDRLHLGNPMPGPRKLASDRLGDYYKAAGWSKPTDNLQDLRHRLVAVELETANNHAKKHSVGRPFVKAVCPLLDSEKQAAEAAYEALRSGRATQSAMAQSSIHPTPQPLTRDMPPPKPFPMDALGPTLSEAAKAIQYRVQCPAALAGQSVLAVASLVTQSHADVFLPTEGRAKPLSLDLITVAQSGERKSTVDGWALEAVTAFQSKRFKEHEELQKQHLSELSKWQLKVDEIKRAKASVEDKQRLLDELGEAPKAPLKPFVKCGEATFEGLVKLFLNGSASLGLFSNEGGHFLGGHAMKAENRLQMGTGLSALWDGQPLERVRAASKDGDGEATLIMGKRLALHLMMQPEVSANLLSDPKLKDQGFLARLLTSFPDSTIGTRFQHPQDGEHARYDAWASQSLMAYSKRVTEFLSQPAPLADGRNELAPRVVPLSADAASLCRDYADHIESQLGPRGDYAPITSFANKMPEHACRIAAVITLFEFGPHEKEIPAFAFNCAKQLVDFYASEALRLWDAAVTTPEIRLAKQVLEWLHRRGEEYVELVDVYKNGPSRELRAKDAALKVINVLVDHQHLTPVGGTKPMWSLVRPA